MRIFGRANQKILNPKSFVDDFGDLVFRCWLTNKLIPVRESRQVGPFNVAVAGTYVCAKDSIKEEKQSRWLWDEQDANCNTCKNLQRVKAPRSKDGLLTGNCPAKNIYQLKFHPDDPMHMPCWKPRSPYNVI
jgi:hypothetical protein